MELPTFEDRQVPAPPEAFMVAPLEVSRNAKAAPNVRERRGLDGEGGRETPNETRPADLTPPYPTRAPGASVIAKNRTKSGRTCGAASLEGGSSGHPGRH